MQMVNFLAFSKRGRVLAQRPNFWDMQAGIQGKSWQQLQRGAHLATGTVTSTTTHYRVQTL
jgi:hypothetical protein